MRVSICVCDAILCCSMLRLRHIFLLTCMHVSRIDYQFVLSVLSTHLRTTVHAFRLIGMYTHMNLEYKLMAPSAIHTV